MNSLNNTHLIAGLSAGVAAAVLSLGATVPSAVSFFLYAATALPILIAGLGWGNRAAIVAIVSAIVLASVAVSPKFAMTISIFTLLPAGWLAHLANLARPAGELGGPDHMLAWYPLSSIMLQLCIIVSFAVVILGIMIGYGPELVSQVVDLTLKNMSAADSAMLLDAQAAEPLKAMLLNLMPMMQGGLWVLLLFTAYYLATRIAHSAGKSARPREAMPAALRMPRQSTFIFLVAMTATFFSGPVAIIGSVVCGTFGAGFLLAGYAAIHHRLKDKTWRLPVLIIAYLAGLFIFPLFLIVVFGMFDVRSLITLTPASKPSDNPPTQD